MVEKSRLGRGLGLGYKVYFTLVKVLHGREIKVRILSLFHISEGSSW